MSIRPEMLFASSRLNSIVIIDSMSVFVSTYITPECRVRDVDIDLNFLASGDFGQGGYPGGDLQPGEEWEL